MSEIHMMLEDTRFFFVGKDLFNEFDELILKCSSARKSIRKLGNTCFKKLSVELPFGRLIVLVLVNHEHLSGARRQNRSVSCGFGSDRVI
jgi:hypothetical protein